MLVDFLYHLVSFDLIWIINLIFSNLHFVFAFVALAFFIWPQKNIVFGFFITISVVWVTNDLALAMGWLYAVGAFLSLHYISRVAITVFTNDLPQLTNKLPLVLTVQFILVFLVFNIFIR